MDAREIREMDGGGGKRSKVKDILFSDGESILYVLGPDGRKSQLRKSRGC